MSKQRNWTPSRLLLEDRYATPSDRIVALERLRSEFQFAIAGFVTYSPTNILPSLTHIFVGEDAFGRGDPEVELLGDLAKERLTERLAFRDESHQGPTPASISSTIASIVATVFPGATSHPVTADPEGYGNLGVAVVVAGDERLHQEPVPENMDRLAATVLGSAMAASHREHAVEIAMKKRLILPMDTDFLPGSVLTDDFLSDLEGKVSVTQRSRVMQLVADETQAEGLFAYESVDGLLVRTEAGVGNPALCHATYALAPRGSATFVSRWSDDRDAGIFDDSGALLAQAFQRNQRLVGLIDGKVALAAPFGNLPARPDEASGVVLLIRPDDGEESPFAPSELGLIRTLCTRLARSVSDRRWFRVIEQLANRLADLGEIELDENGSIVGLPARFSRRRDIRLLNPLLTAILDDLISTTGGLTATFRLVIADGPTHGCRSLLRIAAAGAPVVYNSPPDISIDAGPTDSVNSWVAANGRSCYLRDISPLDADMSSTPRVQTLSAANYPDLESASIYREGIRSELCVPVFAERRLVGTINLESQDPGAFDESAHAVEEYAQLAGLAVIMSRRQISVDMLETAGGFLDTRHTVEGELGRAIERLKTSEVVQRDEQVRASLFNLRRASAALRSSKVSRFAPSRFESMPIGELLEIELDRIASQHGMSLELSRVVETSSLANTIDLFEVFPTPDGGAALSFALAQALSNAAKYSAPQGEYGYVRPGGWDADFSVQLATTRVGGVDNVIVVVQSASWEEDRERIDVERVFREPITDRLGRPRLGAFLAGEAMRRCGGSASFRDAGKLDGLSVHILEAELSVPTEE